MNPRNDEAPTAATVRASDDSTPTTGIGTVNKITTLIPTMAQLERAGCDDHKLLDAAEMNIQRLIDGAEMGGDKRLIRQAKRFMRRLEKRRNEWFHGGAEATPATEVVQS